VEYREITVHNLAVMDSVTLDLVFDGPIGDKESWSTYQIIELLWNSSVIMAMAYDRPFFWPLERGNKHLAEEDA
jgi:hypothetical protein